MKRALRGSGKYPARALCMIGMLYALFFIMHGRLAALPSAQHDPHGMFAHEGDSEDGSSSSGGGGAATARPTEPPPLRQKRARAARIEGDGDPHSGDLGAYVLRGAGGQQETTDAPPRGSGDVREVVKSFDAAHGVRVLHYGHGIFHVQPAVEQRVCRFDDHVIDAAPQPLAVAEEGDDYVVVKAAAAPGGANASAEARVEYTEATGALKVTVGSVTLDFSGDGGAATATQRRVRGATGLAERSSGLALANGTYELWNLDVQYKVGNVDPMYGVVPLVVGVGAAASSSGVLYLNPAHAYVDVATDERAATVTTAWSSKFGCHQFVVYPGVSTADVLRQHALTTGRPFFPPLFSMGYHQCRWGYKTQADVVEVSRRLAEHAMPCDALWLDIDHTEKKHYFTWAKEGFPHPARMLAAVKADGRKMVAITDPHIARDKKYYVHREAEAQGLYMKRNGQPYEGWCWPGKSSWVDFLNPKAREWYAGLFAFDRYEHSTEDLYTWIDMNEPSVFGGPRTTADDDVTHYDGTPHPHVHNLYGLLHANAAYHGQLARTRINSRPFVLTRSFFAGSQRYAAVWTGDNKARWEYLEASVPMLLSLSMGGIPFVGADVGGFFENTDPELMARWFQLGALYPFFRGHAHEETKRKEPYLYQGAYVSAIRNAIHLRYELMPYVYTTFWNATSEGVPVWRPLFLEFPREPVGRVSAFMMGDALLAAPIVRPADKEAGDPTMKVDFPGDAGLTWYHFASHAAHPGGAAATVPAPLETLLLYQKSGTIVVTKEADPAVRSTEDQRKVPYRLRIAVDGATRSARGRVYLDDERTRNYMNGDYNWKELVLEGGALTVRCAHGGPQSAYQAMPPSDKPYTPPSAPVASLLLLGWGDAALPETLTAERIDGGAVLVTGLTLPVFGGWSVDLAAGGKGVVMDAP
eukprot:TRINITY_DN2156_c0_g1_i1.p1 TRINITY_DN2156_c0_g1~~TRINITY_DN2156_c0_g1_i1.p1  ORF type:complete len:923 (+),score=302.61 TRINITY_DN2156_c0_g1_i1:139-2907(+)